MQVPILTYHANNINGNEYFNNDHVALATDLELIDELGVNIISLEQLVAWRLGQADDSTVEHAVVLTCDDGTDFDFHDIEHPTCGRQTSFFNLLKQHQQKTGKYTHMTNFVIVSPEARKELDAKVLIGEGWWSDDWWCDAQQSGLMHIANHSWDHDHGIFDNLNTTDDTFRNVDSEALCDAQIKTAQDHLKLHLGEGYQNEFFAYPYGDFSDYLRFEYLPQKANNLGLKAAFTTEPKHVTKFSKLWAMPRYVCNSDWHNASQLETILKVGHK